jgi:hypothetical protein
MRNPIIAALCFIAIPCNIICQVRKPLLVNTKPGVRVDVIQPLTQSVTLYENTNFTGRSKSLSPGSYRLNSAADVSDVVASIKVPAGVVAVIYENADEGGGYGISVDLMEDCPNLSVYNFNNKVSYVNIFSAKNSAGLIWVRSQNSGGQFVAGHWERQRANGQNPNGIVAVVGPSLPPHAEDPNDLSKAPLATQSEIDEFNNVVNNQSGIGVLGGENSRPFYYHANQPNEVVYKYQKLIDVTRLPSGFLDWANHKLQDKVPIIGGALGLIPYTGEIVIESIDVMKDWLVTRKSTTKWIDSWYPVKENKITVCGTADTNSFICSQDYLHTQLTIDKDVNLDITPSDNFKWVLTNRWLRSNEQAPKLEAEVKTSNLFDYDTKSNKSVETTAPHNPLLLKIAKNTNVCVFGPWMADILDIDGIDVKIPIPFTNDQIDLSKLDINTNDEIHPINQLWYKNGAEMQLIAIADGNGYFDKTGNGEIEASGLNHTRSFYIAFQIPNISGNTSANGVSNPEYNIDAIGFDFDNNPATAIQTQTFALKYHGDVRIKVNDNSIIKVQKTHSVSFDKVRTRPDGSIQGYIVVETMPIIRRGGSINITVKRIDQQQGGIVPIHPVIKG